METLALSHHRCREGARLLIVNKFATRAARARRRRNRTACMSTLGAVVIGCSTDTSEPWHTTVTERGIAIHGSDLSLDSDQAIAGINSEDQA